MLEKLFRAHSSRLQLFYDRMPSSLRTIFTCARGWTLARNRYAPDMYALLAELRSHESWTAEQIAAFQRQALQQLLGRIRRTVPLYADLPDVQLYDTADWQRLPILTREVVRQNHGRLVSHTVASGQIVRVQTTGTTGASLQIAYSTLVARRTWAFRMRQLAWIGIQPREPRVTLFGSRIVPPSRNRPPYWTYNWPERQLLMSSFHLSPGSACDYLACLRRHTGEILEGFPSVLGILADLLLQLSEPVRMRAVLTDGEPLYPFLREKMEKAFQARVYDTYGNTELCGLIQECEHGAMHLAPEFAFLEILNDQGQPLPAGEEGYFVWTAFVNDVMPLVRYRIGDRGCWQGGPPCPCGRAFPRVVPTITRDSDLLHSIDGRIYSPRTVNQLLKAAVSFRFCQFVQDLPDHVIVRAVASNGHSRSDLDVVREKLQRLLGDGMRVGTELAEAPIVRAGGKMPLIVQQVRL